jgi:pimeloyl-ACP methyl ester carboxylesterase
MIPIVMIPGLGSDAAVWQPTIDALGANAECIVGDTLSDASLPGMAARILSQAPDQFALAGVSMGGMIALEIMRRVPERVTRLALIDTNPNPDTPEQIARRETANAAMANATDLIALARPSVAYMLHPNASPEIHQQLLEMTVRVGAAAYIRQNKAVMTRDDLRPILPTITVPTTIVYGANDLMTPVAYGEQLRDNIKGSRLHVIAECGHLPPIERPDAVAVLLR